MKLHDVMAKKRSNSESFLKHGFVRIALDGIERLQSVLCMKVFSNESIKSSKLKRHLESKHNDCKDEDLTFFKKKANCVKQFLMEISEMLKRCFPNCVPRHSSVPWKICRCAAA